MPAFGTSRFKRQTSAPAGTLPHTNTTTTTTSSSSTSTVTPARRPDLTFTTPSNSNTTADHAHHPSSSSNTLHSPPSPSRDSIRAGKHAHHEAVNKTQHTHRRDSSSILSLTTSVADSAKGFSANVKRSVSLRSHRTTLSASGSSLGTATRSPSSAHPFSPLGSTSPVDDSHDGERPRAPSQAPSLKRKISLTAKGLTRKYQSTELLPTLSTPIYLESVGGVRSPAALERPDPMLVSHPPVNAPVGRKLSIPDHKPGLQPQASFTRDISSSHSTATTLQHAPGVTPALPAGPLNPNTIYAQIHEVSAKRMSTIDYIRRLHEGDVFYFGSYYYSKDALHAMPSMHAQKLGRRATNYFLLGHSLPTLLDLNSNNPLEFLKALTNLLAEFETYQTLSGFDASGNAVSRGRMGQMFKSGMGLGGRSGKGRRSSTAILPTDLGTDTKTAEHHGGPHSTNHHALSPHDTASINPTGHEFAFLLTPHISFEPDFNTTLGTLCDTLIDTYGKLMDLVSSPDSCTPAVGEAFSKADKAIRKILVANVVREFEDTTRAGIKAEMAGVGKLALGGLM